MHFAKKDLAKNCTLAVIDSENKALFSLYKDIESCMEEFYECFSLVFDDGILIHCHTDDFIGFVLSISEQDNNIIITTTGERLFRLRKTTALSEISSDRILMPSTLSDDNFTNVFTSDSNSVIAGNHIISAFKDKNYRELVVCDNIKRYGYLTSYNDKGYMICNDKKNFLFLFESPECDLSTQYRGLGEFYIKDKQIFFRTDYGYSCTQDFLVHEINVVEGLADVICSTEANPDILFSLEV